MESRFVHGLNAGQREAALHTEGPVLILAGAGSGKTRVITCRIAHIIATGRATPDQIAAVTFTNKAAAEMRERVASLVGKKAAAAITISTFHAYCLQVLRLHIEKLGFRKNFSIAGEGDSRTLLRRVVEDLGTTDSFAVPTFQSHISLFKNNNEIPGENRDQPVATSMDAKYAGYVPEVFQKYQSALRAANSVDFDDLILLTLQLWEKNATVLNACRRKFKYVMVDEYQDTNRVQFAILRHLVDEHKNLCVVGDDDQSIYAWRGADVRNILDFERHFKGAKIVTLDQNYRSTETILEAANSVIKNNPGRRDKRLWSELGKGRAIDWIIVADEEEEAKEAVKWLKFVQSKSGAPYSDFAILYRSNIQSRPLQIAFRKADIPYTVIGGQDFFERTEVRDIVCYLKVIANPRDEAAFLRVVNVPRRGIGDVTLHRVHNICLERQCSLGQALAAVLKEGQGDHQLSLTDEAGDELAGQRWTQTEQGIRSFLALMKNFRDKFRDRAGTIRHVVEDLLIAIDYRGELERNSKSPAQVAARWENVELVLNAIEAYEEEAKEPSLGGFLDASHLSSDPGARRGGDKKRPGITLMTIHSAKGLEFPFVFIMGVEDGLMPHDRSLKEGTLDEERRLFYVALTRGKRHVTLFEALSRKKHGRERLTTTSRFMAEIPPELLNQRIRAARDMVAARVAPEGEVVEKETRGEDYEE